MRAIFVSAFLALIAMVSSAHAGETKFHLCEYGMQPKPIDIFVPDGFGLLPGSPEVDYRCYLAMTRAKAPENGFGIFDGINLKTRVGVYAALVPDTFYQKYLDQFELQEAPDALLSAWAGFYAGPPLNFFDYNYHVRVDAGIPALPGAWEVTAVLRFGRKDGPKNIRRQAYFLGVPYGKGLNVVLMAFAPIRDEKEPDELLTTQDFQSLTTDLVVWFGRCWHEGVCPREDTVAPSYTVSGLEP